MDEIAKLLDLSGKVALVTGGGSGIGEGAAVWLAKAGARVGLIGKGMDDLDKVKRKIETNGGSALSVEADVSDAEAMQQVTDQLAKEFGRIDIVFANAGVNGVWAPIEELRFKEFEETLSTNLFGTFTAIKCAVPFLKKRGGAVIVTSSVNGSRIFGNTGATAYSSSKAGQVAMAKMLAVELGPSKIRVNVICPGAIDTNISQNTTERNTEKVKIPVEFPEGHIPLTHGKPGTIDQVGQLVLFLASDMSSHISGTEIWIDGAESLIQG